MRVEDRLDVLRVDVLAADDEHVLAAAGDVELAVVEEAEIARLEPAVARSPAASPPSCCDSCRACSRCGSGSRRRGRPAAARRRPIAPSPGCSPAALPRWRPGPSVRRGTHAVLLPEEVGVDRQEPDRALPGRRHREGVLGHRVSSSGSRPAERPDAANVSTNSSTVSLQHRLRAAHHPLEARQVELRRARRRRTTSPGGPARSSGSQTCVPPTLGPSSRAAGAGSSPTRTGDIMWTGTPEDERHQHARDEPHVVVVREPRHDRVAGGVGHEVARTRRTWLSSAFVEILTPFFAPVVPDENCRNASWSGAGKSLRVGAAGRAAPRRPRRNRRTPAPRSGGGP